MKQKPKNGTYKKCELLLEAIEKSLTQYSRYLANNLNYVNAGVKDSTGSSENIVGILLVMMMIITKMTKMMITLMTMMIMITAMMMKIMFTVHPAPFSRLCCHLSTRPIGFLTTLQIN